MTELTWFSTGTPTTELKPTGIGNTVRTWFGREKTFGCFGTYTRYWTDQEFVAPYTWSGEIRMIKMMDQPYTFWNGEVMDWYTPAINMYPVAIDGGMAAYFGFGSKDNPTKVGASATMRNERPERPYGVRTGYDTRSFGLLPGVGPWDNEWHTFSFEVKSNGEYRFIWDGRIVGDVVEKKPVTIQPAKVRLGLRLDFIDAEFRNMRVTKPMPTPTIINGLPGVMHMVSQTRILDTRQGNDIPANMDSRLPITGVPPTNATSVMINAVAVNPLDDGYVTIFSGTRRPSTSSINFRKGGATSNFLIVPVNAARELNVFSSARTDLVIDMVGYIV